ncbi:MAG: V-type ATPase subunit [Clostridia bacterium]
MANNGIIYANTTASALLPKLINQDKQLRILDCKSGDAAVKILMEYGFGDGVTVVNPFEFEKLCDQEEANLYRFIVDFCPKETAKTALTAKYDYHNLKALFKCKYGKNVDFNKLVFKFTDNNVDALKEQIFADIYDSLSERQKAFAVRMDELHVQGALTPSMIDIECDKAMYGEIFDNLKKLHEEKLTAFYQMKVDLTNLSTLFRATEFGFSPRAIKNMLIDGGSLGENVFDCYIEGNGEKFKDLIKITAYREAVDLLLNGKSATDSIVKFEALAENMQMKLFKSIKYLPQEGLNQFFSYVVARNAVIRNIRLIMVCLNNRLDKAEIRERLVETYDR